ncbi:MAG: polyprenyl synthetase family protein [Enterococcus italicus]|uniref:polyprenyl synthetase family protein n=1 Tax=Enterococcus italicus TaxID=246144 RepID=UPI0039950C31
MELHPMWHAYPTLETELEETLVLMEDAIHLKNKPVEQAILQMIHAGGKMLRPAYQLLFSSFGPEQDRKKAIAIAAAIEMLHTATLIHDDIVDEAELRRGLSSIRSQFGNSVAVYAGDYLFVSCFKLMANYASSMKSLQMHSKSMESILNGELGQMDNRYNIDLSVADYLEAISGKTAELFALSCAIGAYESGTSRKFAEQAGKIGLAIGMAFQIMDDILDYTQDQQKLGKPVLEDVKQGVYSLPLILALESDATRLRPLLEKRGNLSQAEQHLIFELVHDLGGVTRAQDFAKEYTDQALKLIKKLPATAERDQLAQLTETILSRQS